MAESVENVRQVIRGVIFDFGGVILEDHWPGVFAKHANTHSWDHETLRKFVEQYFSEANLGKYTNVEEFFHANKPELTATVEDINTVFEEMHANLAIRPDMVELVKSLKPKYKVAMLSNFTSNLEYFLKEVFQIYHLFDVVVNSYDLKIKKPDPAIYQHTLARLELQPQECVFIDDLQINVEGAQAVGMAAIHFQNYDQCRQELAEMVSFSAAI